MSEPEKREKRENRKRKESVLKNARRYGKQGKYGRGSELDKDKYIYFVRVLELWREGFRTDEEKLIFVSNVFAETRNEEINYSSNQIGCRVIEMLLPFAENETIFRYTEALSANLRVYSCDRYASHVLQALLKISCEKSLQENSDIKFKEFTLKVSKFMLNNLEDFIVDTFANHIIRTVFESLSTDREEYAEIVKEFAVRLTAWPQFPDLPYNELSSGLLQTLLPSIKKIDPKLHKKTIKKLIEESFTARTEETSKIPDVFTSKPATFLLETAVCTSSPKLFTQIYAKCFVGNLAELATRRGCNMSIQKLVNCCMEKSEFEAIFDELSDFEKILDAGNTGVLLVLAQTCKRLSAKQGNFVQSLMKALHCAEPRERETMFVQATIHLTPYEKLDAKNSGHYYVNLHGSVIVQMMLDFNKPIKIITSVLSMEQKELMKMLCDSKGSHIIDSYMKSLTVGGKSREKLIYKLMGTYQELAVSKHGSYILETVWAAANLKQRLKIMEELAYKDALWTNSEFGKIIASKMHVQLYKRNKNEWNKMMEKNKQNSSKEEMFAEIVNK